MIKIKIVPRVREEHEQRITNIKNVGEDVFVDLEYSFLSWIEAKKYDSGDYRKYDELKISIGDEIKEWLAAKETQDTTSATQTTLDDAMLYLSETDYTVIKIAEGAATKTAYADILKKRRAARKVLSDSADAVEEPATLE